MLILSKTESERERERERWRTKRVSRKNQRIWIREGRPTYSKVNRIKIIPQSSRRCDLPDWRGSKIQKNRFRRGDQYCKILFLKLVPLFLAKNWCFIGGTWWTFTTYILAPIRRFKPSANLKMDQPGIFFVYFSFIFSLFDQMIPFYSKLMWKMFIQYPMMGFELKTSWLWVSSRRC